MLPETSTPISITFCLSNNPHCCLLALLLNIYTPTNT